MSTTRVFDMSVPADPVVALDDVLPLIMAMPAYWTDGSELRWTEHAWGVLESEGLTTFQDPAEEVQVLCRLLTLTAIVRAFSDLATGSNIDWKGALGTGPDVIAASLDPIALGRLAEQLGVHSRFGASETAAGLAAVIAREEWEDVTATLCQVLGDTALFGASGRPGGPTPRIRSTPALSNASRARAAPTRRTHSNGLRGHASLRC